MSQAQPYDYVRFTWWRNHTPKELVERLKGDFTLTLKTMPPAHATSPYAGGWEIQVKADTLSAFLLDRRAHLFQRVWAPLTRRDMELRKIILSLYPRNRPTPLPWLFSHEPPFLVEEE